MIDVEFKFNLDKRYMKHLAKKSYYNHNYYKLNLYDYGDYIIPRKCDILYEECEDDGGGCYYSLGYFENDEFLPCFTWFDDDKDLYGVEVE